jgi:immunity protein, SdpI family
MRRWFPAACIAIALLASVVLYPRLPDRMAVHWGVNGEANGFAGRFAGAFLLPLIMLGVWGLMAWLPSRDPRAANIQKFRGSYDLTVGVVMAVLAAMHVSVLGVAVGWPIRISLVAPMLVGVVFIVIGNVMPRARSNFIFGIRTPWTLSDDAVWMRAQRVGGYLLVLAGLAFIAAPFVPRPWGIAAAIVASAGAALGSVGYSYWLWARGRRG